MNRKKSELEDRLDDMLSRIALETQEIKELEQQLTDGQILANEALQRDLEGIISGLQMYLRGLREEARCAQQQVLSLQAENQSLQLHLEDSQRHCREQEDSTRTHRQQEELSVLRMETQAQRDRQVQLEAELQQLRKELIRQRMVAQDEKSSLQLEVQTLQRQLAQTRAHFHQTQYDGTRTLLDQSMLEPEEVQTGPEELDEDQYSPEDLLSCSVDHLPSEIQQTRTSREQVRQDHNHSLEHIARLQAQLDHSQNHITQLEAQAGQDQDLVAQLDAQDQESVAQDQERDLQRLRVNLQTSNSRNKNAQQKLEEELEQSRTQLQDVQQERDGLLQQLRSQTNGHRRKLSRLNGKLRQLNRSMCDSDQRTSEQLKSTTEELRALEAVVELLHTHVQQVVEETTRSFTRVKAPSLASQGTQDSGLGLQYPGSPERGRQRDRPPAGGGQRVCVPVAEWKDGDVPTGPAWLLCGAPAAVVYSPPAGGAALHCNIPEHRQQVDRCVCEEAERLEEEKKKKLRLELKQLRRTLRRHK